MVRKYGSTAWSHDFGRCVNSKLRDGGVRNMNGESADDGGGELITNFKNTAVYYDLVNFSDDDSRL